jgi:excisionase family DNA binding protein
MNEEIFLTVKEACEILKITKPTLYSLINAGKIKKIKVGRNTRILKVDLLREFKAEHG